MASSANHSTVKLWMQIVHVEDIGARRPVYVEVPHELSENMRSALHSIGITQLYSHQVWMFLRLWGTIFPEEHQLLNVF